jgi:hypothetical protein
MIAPLNSSERVSADRFEAAVRIIDMSGASEFLSQLNVRGMSSRLNIRALLVGWRCLAIGEESMTIARLARLFLFQLSDAQLLELRVDPQRTQSTRAELEPLSEEVTDVHDRRRRELALKHAYARELQRFSSSWGAIIRVINFSAFAPRPFDGTNAQHANVIARLTPRRTPNWTGSGMLPSGSGTRSSTVAFRCGRGRTRETSGSTV